MEIVSASDFTPICVAFVSVAVGLILFGPRKWILPIFLIGSTLVSMAPHLMILNQTFLVQRILMVCAWARLLARGELAAFTWRPLDKALLLFCVWTVIGDTLLIGTGGAFVYQVANSLLDGFCGYLLCRVLLNGAVELRRLIVTLAGLCLVVAGFMTLEFVTGHNWLTVLGALLDVVQEREGHMRCQAAFSVPITAGTFGVVLLPLFVSCWWQGTDWKRVAVAGSLAATVVIVTAGSGGPLMAFGAVIVGLLFWPLRYQMRAVRWTSLCSLVALHLIMKAPVWFLIDRIHILPGNSSYHRAKVIDTFVKHVSEWWLLGVQSTIDWGWLMEDVCNQYCVNAKHGGMLSLILFIGVLVAGFRQVGQTLRDAEGDPATQRLIWGVGVMMAAHCISFFGISYFDQMRVYWGLALAMVASLPLLVERSELATPAPAPAEAIPSPFPT